MTSLLPPPGTRTRAAVPFVRDLASFGDRPALVDSAGTVSYRELAGRVDEIAGQLSGPRRLVLVPGANQVGPLVGYLGALAAGHPVLLAPGDHPGTVAALRDAYQPDLLLAGAGDQCRIEPLPAAGGHPLHPDLALLLTTSGSTGSAKLVRLSGRNLQANAESRSICSSARTTGPPPRCRCTTATACR